MNDFDSIAADLEGGSKPASMPAFNPSQSYGTPARLLDNLKSTENNTSDPYVVQTKTKAMGDYQFTPDTVATMHRQGIKFNPFDPNEARAAADYKLSLAAAKNGGDWNKAVAEYGGFVTKDPSGYVSKVMNGVQIPRAAQQAPQPAQQPSEFDSIAADLAAPKEQAAQPDMTVTVTPKRNPAPDSVSGLGSVAAGAGRGFGNLVLGGQQLVGKGLEAASHILPDSVSSSVDKAGQWLVEDAAKGAQNLTRQNEPYAAAHPVANMAGDIGGNVAGAAFVPVGKAGEGVNLIGRLLHAAKTGGVLGALQPVEDTANYWWEKAKQGVTGAVLGSVGQGAGETVGKIAGKASNSVANAIMPMLGKAGGLSDDVAAKLATASPELQTAIKQAVAKGQKVDPVALSRQIEADSLPVKMSLTPGQATQSPGTISMEQNLRGRNPAMVQKFNDQNSALVQNLEHIRDTGAPDAVAPDHITAGESLIGSLKNVMAAHDSKTSALYKQLTDANGGNIPLDGQSFAIEANKALGQNMKGAFLPTEIQNILGKFQNGDHPMTFENFENLRTILGAAARGAKDGNVKGAVNTVRETLENMPLPPEAQALKPIADAARNSAKQGFDMLKANPALGAIDSGKVSADNFVQKYVVNGNKADLVNLATTLKDDPVALQTMKAGTVNYLRNQALGQTGNFSQAAYNKGLQALGPKIDVLFSPQEAEQLRTLGNVAKYTQLQPKGAFVNNSNTDVSNYARAGASMAAHAVNAVTHSPLGSVAQSVAEDAIAKKANVTQLRQLLSPAAGTTSPGAVNNFLSNRLPVYAGRAAVVPLAAVGAQAATSKTPKDRAIAR